MWFSSWLRNPKPTSTDGRGRAHASPRRRANFRPRLEALEARWVPSTLTVTSNLDGGGVGTLRGAITYAHSGDTIVFAPSVVGHITLTQGELRINKNLTIQGPGAGKLALDGGTSPAGGARIFEVGAPRHTATLALSGLTLEHGWGSTGYNSFSSVHEGDGGAILNYGTLTVSDCVFSDNTAYNSYSHGGAIYNAGKLTVTNSTFLDNYVSGNSGSASGGGAIYNAGNLTVTNCALSGNAVFGEYVSTLGGYGGGIYNDRNATATITGTTLSNNAAAQGDEIYNLGAMTLDGCGVDGAPPTLTSPHILSFGTLKIK